MKHINTYVVTQQMHRGKMCFNICYKYPTYFYLFCDYHQGAISKMQINIYIFAILHK
jgi:hypothetical protein